MSHSVDACLDGRGVATILREAHARRRDIQPYTICLIEQPRLPHGAESRRQKKAMLPPFKHSPRHVVLPTSSIPIFWIEPRPSLHTILWTFAMQGSTKLPMDRTRTIIVHLMVMSMGAHNVCSAFKSTTSPVIVKVPLTVCDRQLFHYLHASTQSQLVCKIAHV